MYKTAVNVEIPDNIEQTTEKQVKIETKNELVNLLPSLVDFVADQVDYWSQFGFMDKHLSVVDICTSLKQFLKEIKKQDDDSENDNLEDDTYYDYK